ncbi:ferritin-like domain-containing protein [Sphingomonas mucosissima]|uniref:Ferritin-like domain protein n=1 Tax=Sphingomonas mucosissima TaxID=370959 RepID=A0A245ZIN6_9SPHN|nr:ferritin-like domain-containing protein [Sphingomonas mucosissima]OWK29608.1 hypothetical protein SPMU_20280 [Sphingomonas mucosissima]
MSQTETLIETPEGRGPQRVDRRAFFATTIGAATIGAGALALTAAPAAAQAVVSEVDVLNLILNVEYLQANLFAVATGGTVLAAADISGSGTAGAASGARAVSFSDPILAAVAREMAADALAHVRFLRSSLTSNLVVAQPAIDLGASPTGAFSTLARAAGLVGNGQAFDPYANDDNFLLAAFMVKDVAVTAYTGIMDSLTTASFVEAVGGMMSVEAHHAAALRAMLARKGIATLALVDASEAISNARDALDGATDLDQGVRPGTSASGAAIANIAPLNANGLGISRSRQQVLNFFYLNSGTVTTGGFFTAGVNGTIKSTATS